MGWKKTPVIFTCGVAISAVAQSDYFFPSKIIYLFLPSCLLLARPWPGFSLYSTEVMSEHCISGHPGWWISLVLSRDLKQAGAGHPDGQLHHPLALLSIPRTAPAQAAQPQSCLSALPPRVLPGLACKLLVATWRSSGKGAFPSFWSCLIGQVWLLEGQCPWHILSPCSFQLLPLPCFCLIFPIYEVK